MPALEMTSPNDLKNAGLKATLPRLRIINLFETSKLRHMTAEDVYRQLLSEGLDIGLATIYRVLTQFEQAGLLVRHHFESGKAVFELDQGQHHDHIVCLHLRPRRGVLRPGHREAAAAKIARDRGFEIREHALYLYAECVKPQCPHAQGRQQLTAGPPESSHAGPAWRDVALAGRRAHAAAGRARPRWRLKSRSRKPSSQQRREVDGAARRRTISASRATRCRSVGGQPVGRRAGRCGTARRPSTPSATTSRATRTAASPDAAGRCRAAAGPRTAAPR